MSSAGRRPQRTCVACRQTKDQGDLVRYILAPDGKLLVDYRHRLPGRGAYTCIDRQCLKTAIERKLFARSLRRDCCNYDYIRLSDDLLDALKQRISNLLGMARKSGQCLSGSGAVLEALRRPDCPALVLLAEDLSPGIAAKVVGTAGRNQVFCATLFDKSSLGQLLGKGERSVVAIESGSLADALLVELQRYLQMVREN